MSTTPDKNSYEGDIGDFLEIEPVKKRYIPKVSRKKPPGFKDHCVTFYLPSRLSDDSAIPIKLHNELKLATMNFLLVEFDGATLVEGTGFFVGDDAHIHQENTTLCTAYSDLETLKANDSKIRIMANSLAIECEQVCLSVVIDDVMYFYAPSKEYIANYKAPKTRLTTYKRYLELDIKDLQRIREKREFAQKANLKK